jgi:hypothetical protein
MLSIDHSQMALITHVRQNRPVRCGGESYPVGTGYPLTDPKEVQSNQNLVLTVARVVSRTSSGSAHTLGYIYLLANGHHYYQVAPTKTLDSGDRAVERRLFSDTAPRAVRGSRSVVDGILSATPSASWAFPVPSEALASLGLEARPCTAIRNP